MIDDRKWRRWRNDPDARRWLQVIVGGVVGVVAGVMWRWLGLPEPLLLLILGVMAAGLLVFIHRELRWLTRARDELDQFLREHEGDEP